MKPHNVISALASRTGNPNRPGLTGINAALKRMDPTNPGAAAAHAFRVLAEAGLDLETVHPKELVAWLLIVHILALAHWRHISSRPVGEGLVAMQLGDLRLQQLLSADFETLQQLLPRLARRFARLNDLPGMDFAPLARLALAASAWPNKLEQRRLDIALSYTRFQVKSKTDERKAS